MIYLRLHQARNEEVEVGVSRSKQKQAGATGAISLL